MLTFYDAAGAAYPLSDLEPGGFFITHVSGGLDTLSFDISPQHRYYSLIAEETEVEFGDNRYLVKSINERENASTIFCTLDLDFLREGFSYNYNSGETTLANLLSRHLPAGWTAKKAGTVSVKEVVELDAATDYDVILEAANVFGVCYRWNHREQTVEVIRPELIQPGGEYLTEELNLRGCSFKGASTGLITRLYCTGKDGLTFASINGGKTYVENFQYSDKILAASWSDGNCENAQELLDTAMEKLKVLSFPVRSYECDVIDLAKVNPDYDFLSFGLYQVVTLIDRRRGVRTNHQVVEYKEYPLDPARNVVTLANVTQKIETAIKGMENKVNAGLTENRRLLNEFVREADATYSKISETYTKGETEAQIQSQWTQFSEGFRQEVSENYTTKKEAGAILDQVDHIENQKMYRVEVIRENGNMITGQTPSLRLRAAVYSWDREITDTIDEANFQWVRASDNPEQDSRWAQETGKGKKQIVLTGGDIVKSASFGVAVDLPA